MRLNGLAMATVLLLAVIQVAGCTDTPKAFTVPDDAGSVGEQSGVSWPHEVVMTVKEAGTNAPIEGAAVVFFEEIPSGSPRGFFVVPVTTYEALAVARTDASGVVRGLLEPNATISVGVGDADGMTSEIRPELLVGRANETTSITVPLYRTRIGIGLTATFGVTATNPLAQTGQAEPARLDMPFDFSDDPEAAQGYLERVASLALTIRWNNTETSYADLYAALATRDGEAGWVSQDGRQTPNERGLSESVAIEDDELEDSRRAIEAAGLVAGAVTDEPVLTVDGISVEFQIQATFKASDLQITS